MKSVFICGSGRSGTSMLAGLFSGRGFYQGDDLYSPREANPKGFFENQRINSLNERIMVHSIERAHGLDAANLFRTLYRQGQYWLALLPSDLQCVATKDDESELLSLVGRHPFCYKDPRFCYTLELWLDAAPDAVTLCIFRDPGVVVASILKELQAAAYLADLRISITDLYKIWREMHRRLLQMRSAGRKIFFFKYEDLFEERKLKEIENLVGTSLNREFPDRGLSRTHVTVTVDRQTNALYQGLIKLTSGYLEDQVPANCAELLCCVPAENQTSVVALGDWGGQADAIISSEQEKLTKTFSRGALEGLVRHLQEDQQTLAQKLSARDRELDARIMDVADLRREMEVLRSTFEAVLDKSEMQRKVIEMHAETIAQIHASRSWRLTAPLRNVRRILSSGEQDRRGDNSWAHLVPTSVSSRISDSPGGREMKKVVGTIARALVKIVLNIHPRGKTYAYGMLRAVYRRLPGAVEHKRRWAEWVMVLSPDLRQAGLNREAWELSAMTLELGPNYGHRDGVMKRILVAEHRIPTPDKTSGSVRLATMLKMISQLGWKITFISDSERHNYHWVLEDLEKGLSKYECAMAKLDAKVIYGIKAAKAHLQTEGHTYSAALLSYPEVMYRYAPLVRAYLPGARLIYDSVDLHGVRFAREAQIRGDDLGLQEKAGFYERMEQCNFDVADKVIAITSDEKDQILRRNPSSTVHIVPNIHSLAEQVAPIAGRAGLLFIGHYLHAPNEDAVVYFVGEILPRIKERLGNIDFYMLGSSITDNVKRLASKHIHAIGYVEDPVPFFSRSRVFVAPLRFGAGMKGKIGQSLSLGLPIVTTSIGSEGMGLQPGKDVLVSDDPAGFAEAVIRLYREDELWLQLSAAGRKYIDANLSERAVTQAIQDLFN